MKKGIVIAISLVVLIAILWGFISYYQNRPCPPGPNLSYCEDKIHTVIIDGVTSTYTYELPGGKGRLISIISPASNISFDYNAIPGKVKVTNNGAVIIYTLDNFGNTVCDDRNTTSCAAGTPYTYNYDYPGGYLTQDMDTQNTNVYMIINGNITQDTRSGANPATFTWEYTDYCSAYENRWGFMGKNNRNWPSKFTNGSAVTTYKYEFDTKGRVITQRASGAGNSIWQITYY